MRAIPIDDFFEDLEERGGAGTTSAYDWRRLVSEGRAARGAMDGGKWRIGMLALLVERRYASGALQRFADDIGESYATVRRYRWVAKAYDPNTRTRFADLSFSHFQAVAGLPDKMAWLERAERGSWSVDRLTRESHAAVPPAKASRRVEDPLPGLRRSLDGVRRSIEPASLLDDVALAEAGREWLADELDVLAESIGRLRERVHRATQRAGAVRSAKVARVRTTKPKPARKVATSENGNRSRNTALKARAVGR